MDKFEQAIRNIDAFLNCSENTLPSYRIWTTRNIIDEVLSEDEEEKFKENEQRMEALKQSEQEAQEIIAELKYKNEEFKKAFNKITETIISSHFKGFHDEPQSQVKSLQYYINVKQDKLDKILDIICKTKENQ